MRDISQKTYEFSLQVYTCSRREESIQMKIQYTQDSLNYLP